MRQLAGRAGLLLGVVLLTVLLAAGQGFPLRKPRGPRSRSRPRSQARLAEVSGGAQGCAHSVPLSARPLWSRGERGRDANSGRRVREPGAQGRRSPHSPGCVAGQPGENLHFPAE